MFSITSCIVLLILLSGPCTSASCTNSLPYPGIFEENRNNYYALQMGYCSVVAAKPERPKQPDLVKGHRRGVSKDKLRQICKGQRIVRREKLLLARPDEHRLMALIRTPLALVVRIYTDMNQFRIGKLRELKVGETNPKTGETDFVSSITPLILMEWGLVTIEEGRIRDAVGDTQRQWGKSELKMRRNGNLAAASDVGIRRVPRVKWERTSNLPPGLCQSGFPSPQ
ncbi:hypothetical protein B0H16DRAFT_1470689 [Mycena metata]|uniref:Uncharacterized protein n=1 Tax=Mycena metata TaxID=1033252 RepID=A0AAD7HTR5_9AGAR|nr:hypothetical protein B0H16DRAFT_1470689 [Mycena metata]